MRGRGRREHTRTAEKVQSDTIRVEGANRRGNQLHCLLGFRPARELVIGKNLFSENKLCTMLKIKIISARRASRGKKK
jgi:hypothetical protein